MKPSYFWETKHQFYSKSYSILFYQSIRNQFLCSEISPILDLLLVSETNLDDSFPTAQFLMSGFCKPYRLDYCSNGGDLLLYIREDIPSRLLTE